MSRTPRIVIAGQALHLVQRGNNRQAVFFSKEDYEKYLDVLKLAADKHGCAVHAYVLMTNHVHLLITPAAPESVSGMMQTIGRTYVSYVNKMYRRSGTLWEGRFKSGLIDSERYLLVCSRYIELNPVRAGMVTAPGEYRWSSYGRNALGLRNNLVSPHRIYQQLGLTDVDRQSAYKALFRYHVDTDTLSLIRNSTNQCTVIGNRRFQAEVEAMLKRRVMKDTHGGDRKSREFRERSSDRSSDLTP
jgi:putative transposase